MTTLLWTLSTNNKRSDTLKEKDDLNKSGGKMSNLTKRMKAYPWRNSNKFTYSLTESFVPSNWILVFWWKLLFYQPNFVHMIFWLIPKSHVLWVVSEGTNQRKSSFFCARLISCLWPSRNVSLFLISLPSRTKTTSRLFCWHSRRYWSKQSLARSRRKYLIWIHFCVI